MWLESTLKDIVFYIINPFVQTQEESAYRKLLTKLAVSGYKVFEYNENDTDIEHDVFATLIVTDDNRFARDYVMKGYAVLGYDGTGSYRIPSAEDVFESMVEMEPEDINEVYCRLKCIPKYILETERCYVREISLNDIPRLYEIYANPSITKYMEPLFERQEDELAYTKSYIKNVYGLYGYGMWLLIEKESNTVIGRIGVEMKENPLDEGLAHEKCRGGVEIGFMIAQEYQGKGYAKEAVRAVLSYCKQHIGTRLVYAMVDRDNEASIGLCERVGFVYKETVPQNGRIFSYYEYMNN